jgi:hypothetical protein
VLRFACAYGIGWLAWLLTLPARPPEWPILLTGLPLLVLASRAAWRGHVDDWRRFVWRAWDVHALGLILLIALAVQFADSHGVTTDGVIYLTQLRSVLFDGDLDVAAEFAFLAQPPRPSHVVPIGPTIVWLPLYLAVAVVHWLARVIGIAAPEGGVSLGLTLPYIRAALVSSFALGAAGLFVVHAHMRREFSPGIALGATSLIFAATPLIWYMVYEPSMTHAASFGFVAVFVVASAALSNVRMTAAASVLLGVLLGLAVMTRPQEAVFALVPALVLAFAREPVSVRVAAALRLAGWALVGVAPFLVLQAVHSAILLNREPFALVGGGGYLDFANSRWAETLWSSWHGFFSWTPVTYVAFVAMIAYLRWNPAWAVAAVLTVLIMAWVNGSTADWSGGWSFGGRRFISVLPLLAPGAAVVIWALVRRPLIALALVGVATTGWNVLLIRQHLEGALDAQQPSSFTGIIRRQATLATAPPFVYPFAFPANVVFAWRTGLPLDAYDLLGSESLRPAMTIEMDAATDRFLAGGWGARATDPFGTLRWIDGDRAEVILPLDLAPAQSVTVSWTARTRHLDPPELVTFALMINGRETFRFTPASEQSSHFAFTVPPGDGLFVQGFNRIAFERRLGGAPVAVYGVGVGTKN